MHVHGPFRSTNQDNRIQRRSRFSRNYQNIIRTCGKLLPVGTNAPLLRGDPGGEKPAGDGCDHPSMRSEATDGTPAPLHHLQVALCTVC